MLLPMWVGFLEAGNLIRFFFCCTGYVMFSETKWLWKIENVVYQTSTPDLQISIPDLKILTPHFEISTPDRQISLPVRNISAPNLEISTPSQIFDKKEIAPQALGWCGIAASNIKECQKRWITGKFRISTGSHQFRRASMRSAPNRPLYNFFPVPMAEHEEKQRVWRPPHSYRQLPGLW